MNASIELPKYRSHKTVWALAIAAIHALPNPDPSGNSAAASYGATIVPADERYAPFDVPAEYVIKHRPEPGGYFVRYADGYASYSPAEPFEGGYTLIDTSPSVAPTVSQGSKQPVGLTIKNEGQDSQRVLFARIDGSNPEQPRVVDSVLVEPGQEMQTTLAAGLVVQLAMPPAAANDEDAGAPSTTASTDTGKKSKPAKKTAADPSAPGS